MGKRLILELSAGGLLAVAAIAGWVHKPAAPAPVAGMEYAAVAAPNGCVPVARIPSGQVAQPMAPYYAPAPARVAAQPRAYAAAPVRRGRSTGKSVAIVAGSAGVGAAVGALAGGGKGAAIGALAGGGAGLVYDRLTHKTHSGL